jgi:uncharacterized protein YuzE
VAAKLSFKYDRDADILHIDKRSPYPEQQSEELGDEIIARLNPDTGEVENLEVLFSQLGCCAPISSNCRCPRTCALLPMIEPAPPAARSG